MQRRAIILSTAALAVPAFAQEVVLGVSLASDTNPFYIAMRRGVEEAARAQGWRTRFVTANEDVVAQNNGVLDLIAQRVSGILISPIDERATRAGYEAAAAANIPIISVARHADAPQQSAFVAMDEVGIGRDIARWVLRAINNQGEVAMIAGPQGAATFRNLSAGFAEVIAAAPTVRLVARREVQLTREEGLRVAQDLLVAHPNLKAIYCGNDEIALGAAQALVASGRAGQVVITGLNGIPPAVAAVRRGDMGLTVELSPVAWGRLGVETMARWLRGERNLGQVNVGHTLVDRTNLPPAR